MAAKMRKCECGADPQIVMDVTNRYHAVECPECGTTTGFVTVDADVIERWNDGAVARYADWVVGLG